MICNFSEFCTALLKAGFSGAIGGKDDGVFGLFRYGWGAEDENAVHWHTDDPDTDPWLWRVRVLIERQDIAYSKVFYRKAGYITEEWYPYFLAARRGGSQTFGDAYADGLYSRQSKRIFQILKENGPLPLQEIKTLGGFGREDKSRFDKALTDLQMGLFITMCGTAQKRNKNGEGYGWASTVFSTTEAFWSEEVFKKASALSPKEAENAIAEQIYLLNPNAAPKKIKKFICGSTII